jgi:hypothetical protein
MHKSQGLYHNTINNGSAKHYYISCLSVWCIFTKNCQKLHILIAGELIDELTTLYKNTTLYNVIQDYTTLYKAIRDYTTLYKVIQHNTTIHNNKQGYTTLYNTI